MKTVKEIREILKSKNYCLCEERKALLKFSHLISTI